VYNTEFRACDGVMQVLSTATRQLSLVQLLLSYFPYDDQVSIIFASTEHQLQLVKSEHDRMGDP
jgi:hypothetical protein